MKKIFLLFAVIAINFISYGQGGGFKPQGAVMTANEVRGNIGLMQKACNNTLDISTPTNWVPVGSIPTTVSTFYANPNWIAINNPQVKTYQFKRTFYIGRAGIYKISVKGMGDNKMVLNVDSPANQVFDKDITVAAGFNTPTSATVDVTLECGIHVLNVELTNHGGPAGFYLDGTISSKDGCVNDEKVACEVFKEVCRCPQGWLSNSSGKDGDITTDGKCKKLACGPMGIKPPKNGTSIGPDNNQWGFTWGGEFWAWGTKENGGSMNCKREWVSENPSSNPNVKPGEGRGEK